MNVEIRTIDVLVITYNHEKFIGEALDSVGLQSTVHDIRIVVADDSSQDATLSIVASWQQDHPTCNVTVLPRVNRLGITMNYYRGMSACTADYIAVLEGDDVWLASDKLDRQVALLEQNKHLSMSATRLLVLNQEEPEDVHVRPLLGLDSFWLEIDDQALAEENSIGSFSSCVYRGDVVRQLPFELYEMTTYDWAFNLAVTASGPIGFLPIAGTMYRKHGNGVWSSRSDSERYHELQSLIPQYISFFGERLENPLSWHLRRVRFTVRSLGDNQPSMASNNLINANQVGESKEPGFHKQRIASKANLPIFGEVTPRVSVLLTSYNRSNFVGEAIESVLRQSFQDFELIIVDDCSSDESWDVINSYNNAKIRAYRMENNVGGADSLNYAVQEARGELIAVINCDDTWVPNKIERQIAVIDHNPEIGAVFTSARYIDEQGNIIGAEKLPSWFDTFSQRNRSQGQWLRKFFAEGNALCHPSVLIHREFYLERGLYDNRFRQLPDFERWVALVKWRPIYVMGTFESVNFRLMSGHRNASSVTPENSIRDYRECSMIFEGIFEDCTEDIFTEGFSDIFSDQFVKTNRLVNCEQILVWFASTEPMSALHREVGIRMLMRALEDPNQRELFRRHYGISDHKLHEYMSLPIHSDHGFGATEGARIRKSIIAVESMSPETLSTRGLIGEVKRRIQATPLRRVPLKTLQVLRRPKV